MSGDTVARVHTVLSNRQWMTREGLAKELGAELEEIDDAIVSLMRTDDITTIELSKDTLVLMQATPREAIVELSDRRELNEIEEEFDRREDR